MGYEQDIGVGKEAGVDLGLFFVDVETDAGDLAGFEGGDEGGFVHDGASGGVDDDDAGFHDGELGGGDCVSSGGL